MKKIINEYNKQIPNIFDEWVYINYGYVNRVKLSSSAPKYLRKNTIQFNKRFNYLKNLLVNNILVNKSIKSDKFTLITNRHFTNNELIIESNKCIISIDTYSSIYIYYKEVDLEYIELLVNSIEKFLVSRYKKSRDKKAKINLLVKEDYGIDFKEKVLSFDPKIVNLKKHYNDDVYDKITGEKGLLYWLSQSNKSGLHLLHSVPGTGKTTLIKWLTSKEFKGKKVFYISPSMTQVLTSPDLVQFITDEANNGIIVVEDAESVLAKRSQGSSDAVSNILNMTDGILGDILNVQIICTLNTDKSNIDEALLRPGRLLTDIELGPLSIDKSDKLLRDLGKIPRGKELRICDIFNEDARLKKTINQK